MLVGRSHSLSVTFLFPINNSRTPCPTFFKLGPHIRPGQQMNTIDFVFTGSKVKVTGLNLPKPFPINNWRTP